MDLYLDTSAVLKRYKTEAGTDVIDHLFSSEHALLTSQYSIVEIWAVGARALKGHVLDQDAYDKLNAQSRSRGRYGVSEEVGLVAGTVPVIS